MKLLVISCILITIVSCDIQEEWMLGVPSFNENSALLDAKALPDNALYALEGIYFVNNGNGVFGDTLVLKRTRDKISLFGNNKGVYFIGSAGVKGSTIIIEGYWRNALSNGTGLARFTIPNAVSLLDGDTLTSEIEIAGVYGRNNNLPAEGIKLTLARRFSPKLRADPFIIGAHRGGGRTSDRLPYSENTVEIIKFAEYLGATGIEIDIQMTSDLVPVLYHDEDLNIRLVQKGPLLGAIEDYTFKQLRTFVKLIHGENIPSLEEALKAVLNETQLRSVWLDVKDAKAVDKIIPIQQSIMAEAAKRGRKLEILIGIPSNEVYDALKTHTNYKDIPSLSELDLAKTSDIGAKTWAFRWTLGLMEDHVAKVHAEGRKCYVWTIDLPQFIDVYISHGGSDPVKRFDGILSNYSNLIAYYHYTKHNF